MSHQPQTINKFKTGLVQYQPQQVLSDDALTYLFNAVVFRNVITRRDAWDSLGRLKRDLTAKSLGMSGASPWTFTIYSTLVPPITGEPNAQIKAGSVSITLGVIVFTDNGDGTLSSVTPGNSGLINYATGVATLTHTAGVVATTIDFSYFPALPVMGIFDRNTTGNTFDTLYFDTKYSYRYSSALGFEQFPVGNGVWSLNDFNLPSYANYWQSDSALPGQNDPIFWYTNIKGQTGEPIRFTDYVSNAWYDFTPSIDGGTNFLFQAKFLIPFRGRLFAFNTYEGLNQASSVQRRNRVRCCAQTTPFYQAVPGVIFTFNANAWNDTIPGQGYYQDIPTTEEIIGAWSVMNQIVIKTETKTWVLSDTGISIAPFKIELVDDNEGSTSGFSAANMGKSIIDIGTRSINNTSPNEVNSIDQKILDFVYTLNIANNGLDRIYGMRDFKHRWNSYIYPYQVVDNYEVTYPNRRLIYNYDNGSFAIYSDSLTCLGYFRSPTNSITWAEANFTWAEADFTWAADQSNELIVAGGNQQGFVGLTDADVDEGPSLAITNIISNGLQAAFFDSVNHNLETGQIVQITGVLGAYSTLNGTVAKVQTIDKDRFILTSYDPLTDEFSVFVIVPAGTYIGGGLLTLRKNFGIQTKAFNLIEEGQSMHISYLDTLVNVNQGISANLSIFVSQNNNSPVNEEPQTFNATPLFNRNISMSPGTTYLVNKTNNRTIVNQRANMITMLFSLSNSVLNSDEHSTQFVISSYTIWKRRAGRPLMPFGGG